MRALYLSFSGVIFLLSACSELGSYQDPTTTLTTTPLPSSSSSPVSVPAAIHEWQFDGNGNDTGSVSGWTGSLSGAAVYTPTSADVKSGTKALQLTGGYFDFGAQTLPNETTIACWVLLNGGGSGQNTIIANTDTTAQNGFILSVTAITGQINLETGNGTAATTLSSLGAVTPGTYAHVAVTLDSTGNMSNIYINGAFDSSGNLQPGFPLAGVSGGHTLVGSMTTNASPFLGDLDDCRIYNTLLSGAQVSALYGSY